MIKLLDLLENKIEIKNLNYYKQLLDMNSKLSISNKQYFQKILDSIKKQDNLATPRQYDILQRLKSGDFKYNTKN
jgi:hypothetical protein